MAGQHAQCVVHACRHRRCRRARAAPRSRWHSASWSASFMPRMPAMQRTQCMRCIFASRLHHWLHGQLHCLEHLHIRADIDSSKAQRQSLLPQHILLAFLYVPVTSGLALKVNFVNFINDIVNLTIPFLSIWRLCLQSTPHLDTWPARHQTGRRHCRGSQRWRPCQQRSSCQRACRLHSWTQPHKRLQACSK